MTGDAAALGERPAPDTKADKIGQCGMTDDQEKNSR